MYSSEDLERFYFQYQTEAMPKGISIEQFCSRNKVPYNIFYKWYKDTRNKIVEVKVDSLPASCQKIQRRTLKGSLFFGSVQGALRSAMYNTFIQTCKQVGVSFRQYFKALLKAVKSGRTDYENLLPMTISLER